MTSRLVLLGALLIPTVAFAQPADSDAPPSAPATSQPTVVAAPAPAPPPPVATPAYQEVEDSSNAPVFVSGLLVFGATYGASAIVAATNDDRSNHRLYVPVVGPWLALADRGSCDISRSSCDHETTAKVLLAADGVFQAAGLLAMLDGIFQPSTHRVITRAAKLDTKVHVTPTITHGDPGVSVFGRF